ncbi:MAG: hypothetical protein DIZ80_13140 [endosymbiont of Galathealinum brachiosum]|uniref:Uncharacterized protein n=1 Tax=endosymbiont of Galathealinum brachiosum TaxID=2200906 RepID=A0A370D902_9GAMM|nr:MAG: hypothetical protein DIZ80_13140 [endosymbiont of Galathealinum brachiosum]
MPSLHITKIHITLQIKVPHELLERHLPSSAEVVGEALTEQVITAVKKHKLSYFPALEFLEKQGDLEQDLLDATETISWFACKFAREEVNKKLRAFFSELSFQSVKCTTYAMPGVRANQINAWHELVEHYTPNTVKLDVVASLLKKEQHLKGIENWSRQLFRRNLEGSFDEFEVIQAVIL